MFASWYVFKVKRTLISALSCGRSCANLIRQSIKDSVWLGIDHGADLVRWNFFFNDQTTIAIKLKKIHSPEPTLFEGL